MKQEGFLGFTRAFELYRPELSAFLTYAQYWVRMAMYSYAYRASYAVEVPEDFHLTFSKYQRLLQDHPECSNDMKVAAEKLGIARLRLERVVFAIKGLKYHAQLENVDGSGKFDLDCYEAASRTERGSKLRDTLSEALTPEEAFVIDNLFGLTTNSRKTLGWVGSIMSVSKERVRQIKVAALKKLRAYIDETHTLEVDDVV